MEELKIIRNETCIYKSTTFFKSSVKLEDITVVKHSIGNFNETSNVSTL